MDWCSIDAEASFAALLDACLRDGPQIVTQHGAEAAVLVPADEWRRLQPAAKPSLKDLLLEDGARFDLSLPNRSSNHNRLPPTFD